MKGYGESIDAWSSLEPVSGSSGGGGSLLGLCRFGDLLTLPDRRDLGHSRPHESFFDLLRRPALGILGLFLHGQIVDGGLVLLPLIIRVRELVLDLLKSRGLFLFLLFTLYAFCFHLLGQVSEGSGDGSER